MSLEGKKVVMIVAPEDFRDEEYFVPKKILEDAGAEVITASKSENPKSKFGEEIKADILFEDVTNDFDAIVFVGGGGSSVYFNDEKAHSLAKDAYNNHKVVAAICIAPSTLANAGLLEGKKATCYQSEENNLKDKGADYTGEPVTKDGNIITANGPEAAEEFGKTIAESLS